MTDPRSPSVRASSASPILVELVAAGLVVAFGASLAEVAVKINPNQTYDPSDILLKNMVRASHWLRDIGFDEASEIIEEVGNVVQKIDINEYEFWKFIIPWSLP